MATKKMHPTQCKNLLVTKLADCKKLRPTETELITKKLAGCESHVGLHRVYGASGKIVGNTFLLWTDKSVDKESGEFQNEIGTYEASFIRFLRRSLEISEREIPDSAATVIHTLLHTESQVVEHRGSGVHTCYKNGPKSCMGGPGASAELLAVYINNPERVSILFDESDAGNPYRAMLWLDDEGVRVLDRCYPGPHPAFDQYLTATYGECGVKWVKRLSSSASNANGEPVTDKKVHTVTLKSWPRKFPYLDTMMFLGKNEAKDGTVTNFVSNIPRAGTFGLAHSTGGGWEDIHVEVCSHCGHSELDRAFRTGPDRKVYCRTCYTEKFLDCPVCGQVVPKGETFEATRTGDGRTNAPVHVCKQCFELRFSPCMHCGTRHLTGDLEQTYDMFQLCPVCMKTYTTQCPCCKTGGSTPPFYTEERREEHMRTMHKDAPETKALAGKTPGSTLDPN